jgi:hypothetical protein
MYKNFTHQKSPYNAKDAMENFQIDIVIKSTQKPMKVKSVINVTCKEFKIFFKKIHANHLYIKRCSYASISARHLESHMLIHSDQKPYNCMYLKSSEFRNIFDNKDFFQVLFVIKLLDKNNFLNDMKIFIIIQIMLQQHRRKKLIYVQHAKKHFVIKVI